jgi:hypothetical protein
MTLFYQCDLEEEKWPKARKMTVWIEERGAKEGALVEIKALGSRMWAVRKVYRQNPFEATKLAAKQANDRNAFGSLL